MREIVRSQAVGVVEFELDMGAAAFAHEIRETTRNRQNTEYVSWDFNRQRDASVDNPTRSEYPEKYALVARMKPIPKVDKRDIERLSLRHFNYSDYVSFGFSDFLRLAQEKLDVFINDNLIEDVILIVGIGMDQAEADRIFEENVQKDNFINPIQLAPKIKVKWLPLNQVGIGWKNNFLNELIGKYPDLKSAILPYTQFRLERSTEFAAPLENDQFYGLIPPNTKALHDWLDFRDAVIERGAKLTLGRIAEILGMNANTVRRKSVAYDRRKIVDGSIKNNDGN